MVDIHADPVLFSHTSPRGSILVQLKSSSLTQSYFQRTARQVSVDTSIMATTFFKSMKKKGDGRPGLNRQDSVQTTATKNPLPKAPKYQNSYRLEPYKIFNVEPVDKIVQQVMTNNLEDIVYDPKECPKLCAEISADIRNRIRKQNFDRYKIVVIVTINEKASQAIQTSMRFIWDIQRDNYSSFTFETRTFFAYCCVFGVYCE